VGLGVNEDIVDAGYSEASQSAPEPFAKGYKTKSYKTM
jgi:hypothetical protein